MHHRLPGSAATRALQLRGLGALLGVFMALLVQVSAPSAVSAEAVDMAVQSDEPAEYRDRIDEALREFSVQNYEEARSLFLQAHALAPSARTLRALGLCEYELRNYGESVKYLQAALASNVKPLRDALRSDTERMITRARGFVGRVEVELRPANATLMVDGVKVDAKEPLWLAMGERTLEVSANGFTSEKRKLNVKGGEDKKLSIILAASDADGGDKNAGSQKQSSGKRWYKSPWLWASVGVVLVGAGAATAIVLTRDKDSDNTPVLPTN